MKIINKTKNTVLAEDVIVAKDIFSRLKGLLGKSGLRNKEALIITPCDSIHTFFMKFSIDVVFIDKKNRVVKVISSMKPFRISAVYFNAHSVIELPPGIIRETATTVGDSLSLG